MPEQATASNIDQAFTQILADYNSEAAQRFYFPENFKDMKKPQNTHVYYPDGSNQQLENDYLLRQLLYLATQKILPIAVKIDDRLLLFDRAMVGELDKNEITEAEFIEQLQITGLYRSKFDMDHRNGILTESGSLWARLPNTTIIRLVDKDRPVTITFETDLFTKIV